VIDVMEVYTTDAGIRYHNIKLLRDDREHFSLYEAVLLYRADLDKREPRLVRGMLALTEKISAVDMLAMNSAAQLERIPEREVAARFLAEALSLEVAPKVETRLLRLKKYTLEHLAMVRLSFLLAILCGLPLGILAAKKRRLGQVVLALVGMIQTIPALALLVILIQPAAFLGLGGVGSGSAAAIAALFLYSLLPIVRNTCEGLRDISPDLSEAALALGLPPAARLFEVELPLASRTILAGLKTAAILNIGFATLGALIGAGGYGQPILTGIRLDDSALILEGALPSALLALLAQGLFEILDRVLIPAGLRLPPAD
jgi:osmoprotectant transport system permease protein